MRGPGWRIFACLLVGLLVWPLAFGAPAQIRDRERTVDFAIRYLVTAMPGARSAEFTCLVPKDLPRRQEVEEIAITPKPDKVFDDGTGRYARFSLDFAAAQQIEIRIQVKLRLLRADLSSLPRLSSAQLLAAAAERKAAHAAYLGAEKWHETAAPEIRSALTKVKSSQRQELVVERIWELVTDTMRPSGHNRASIGAVEALRRKTGDCTDYADLFITLCRAKGIPARMVDGYTIPWNNTPTHNWSEVYLDQYGWVPFDPHRGEWSTSRFKQLENVYVYLSQVRTDKVLNGYHYYSFTGSITVEDSIVSGRGK